jgi:murein DD-endopeptidase MepM/ murein hydrolase activator NlpD
LPRQHSTLGVKIEPKIIRCGKILGVSGSLWDLCFRLNCAAQKKSNIKHAKISIYDIDGCVSNTILRNDFLLRNTNEFGVIARSTNKRKNLSLDTHDEASFWINQTLDHNIIPTRVDVHVQSVDDFGKILYLKRSARINIHERKVRMTLPVAGTWFIKNGPDIKGIHRIEPSQRFAMDLVVAKVNGATFIKKGDKNIDYYAFDKPILAPAGGKVIEVRDNIKDNKPGKLPSIKELMQDIKLAAGNFIILEHHGNIYSCLAHFKFKSIKVRIGDNVRTEQIVGHCGNSGNSHEPHVHFHIMDGPELFKSNGLPIEFTDIQSSLFGHMKVYSPFTGDFVSSAKLRVIPKNYLQKYLFHSSASTNCYYL